MAAMETKSTSVSDAIHPQADAMDVLVGIIGKEHADALVDGSSTSLEWVCEDELAHESSGHIDKTKDKLGKAGIEALAGLFPVRLRGRTGWSTYWWN